MTAADILGRTASSLKCIRGTFRAFYLQLTGKMQDRLRPAGLREAVQEAGGLEQDLKDKADVQNSDVAAIALYEMRREGKHLMKQGGSKEKSESQTMRMMTTSPDTDPRPQEETGETRHVNPVKEQQVKKEGDRRRKPTDNGRGRAQLTNNKKSKKLKHQDKGSCSNDNKRKDEWPPPSNRQPEEGSDEHWNHQRAKL